MYACIDEPSSESRIDPLCFRVRGWARPPGGFAKGDVVEAWADGAVIGATAAVHERPDVTAALGLPPGTSTGFEFFAHHPSTNGAAFELQLRLRRAVFLLRA